MLPSLISNLIWGSPESDEDKGEVEVQHTTNEEPGDWLLISCKDPGDSTGHISRVSSESDRESACSDGSWVITPAPTFRESSQSSSDIFHPMEDLLIEHPTMSVYHHVRNNSNEKQETSSHHVCGQNSNESVNNNCNRELVLLRNRRRHQVAVHLDIPVTAHPPKVLPVCNPPKLTRKALRRQNINVHRGKESFRVQKKRFKPGRRKC